MGLHRLFPGWHTLRTVPVALAPVLIGSVCFLGSDLSVWVFFHHLVNEAGNLIAVPPILGRSFPDSARCIKPGLLQQPQPIQAPVEDAAQVLRLPQPPFQGLVLLFLGEVPVERDHFHPPGIKHCGVCHLWQVVGVDEQLELRDKLEGVFVEETSVDGVPARESLYQAGG